MSNYVTHEELEDFKNEIPFKVVYKNVTFTEKNVSATGYPNSTYIRWFYNTQTLSVYKKASEYLNKSNLSISISVKSIQFEIYNTNYRNMQVTASIEHETEGDYTTLVEKQNIPGTSKIIVIDPSLINSSYIACNSHSNIIVTLDATGDRRVPSDAENLRVEATLKISYMDT